MRTKCPYNITCLKTDSNLIPETWSFEFVVQKRQRYGATTYAYYIIQVWLRRAVCFHGKAVPGIILSLLQCIISIVCILHGTEPGDDSKPSNEPTDVHKISK